MMNYDFRHLVSYVKVGRCYKVRVTFFRVIEYDPV